MPRREGSIFIKDYKNAAANLAVESYNLVFDPSSDTDLGIEQWSTKKTQQGYWTKHPAQMAWRQINGLLFRHAKGRLVTLAVVFYLKVSCLDGRGSSIHTCQLGWCNQYPSQSQKQMWNSITIRTKPAYTNAHIIGTSDMWTLRVIHRHNAALRVPYHPRHYYKIYGTRRLLFLPELRTRMPRFISQRNIPIYTVTRKLRQQRKPTQ